MRVLAINFLDLDAFFVPFSLRAFLVKGKPGEKYIFALKKNNCLSLAFSQQCKDREIIWLWVQ